MPEKLTEESQEQKVKKREGKATKIIRYGLFTVAMLLIVIVLIMASLDKCAR